ncbi:death ligand signal enhancer isoform X2 [Heptranchias perlo]|uniref:death ligand signal enhancer isoform X2 n=1 Tax=Heptranchias perlo TaxID=212740 RepID=UPI0035599097
MWRLKALLGRVLHRCPVTGPSPSLRLPSTHCAEDDVLNPSSLISTRLPFENSSTDSRNGDAGERRKKADEESTRFYSKQLPRFSGLDAVGWGAAAVVFLQFARHLHHHFCHHNGPRESDAGSRFCVRSIIASTLAPHRNKFSRCILPECEGPRSISKLTDQNSVPAGSSPSANGSAARLRTAQQENDDTAEQDEPLLIKGTQCGVTGGNGQRGDLQAALYYSRAASQGHLMAQYRWARYLLHGKPGSEVRDTQKAIEQLEKTAKSGLKEAQAYLGVFYTKEPYQDLRQAARYLRMASESGDASSQYHLGICYQKGWGVIQDTQRAAQLYRKAAALEHADAQCALGVLYQQGLGGLPVNFLKAIELYQRAARSGSDEAVHNLQLLMKDFQIKGSFSSPCERGTLRSVMSSPCLPARGRPRPPFPQQRPTQLDEDRAGHPWPAGMALSLPHSWSTGSLRASPVSYTVLATRAELPGSARVTGLDHHAQLSLTQIAFCSGVPGVG